MSATTPLGDQMRKTADWMSPSTDDRILEVIRKEGNMTPLALSREGKEERVDIGRKYAGERCRELAKYGLLYKIEKGLFGITQKGEAYLDEELDASELDPVEDVD